MARGDFPSSKQDQYMVRFPDGMRDRLKQAAADNKRSMNAEIIARLEDTFLRDNNATAFDAMVEVSGKSDEFDGAMARALGDAVRRVLREHGYEYHSTYTLEDENKE